jgi:hypothetical protein
LEVVDDEVKLGFHRLGRRLEDPVELFAVLAVAWAGAVILIALAIKLSVLQWFLLLVAGIAVLLLLRGRIIALSERGKRERVELEERGIDRTADAGEGDSESTPGPESARREPFPGGERG